MLAKEPGAAGRRQPAALGTEALALRAVRATEPAAPDAAEDATGVTRVLPLGATADRARHAASGFPPRRPGRPDRRPSRRGHRPRLPAPGPVQPAALAGAGPGARGGGGRGAAAGAGVRHRPGRDRRDHRSADVARGHRTDRRSTWRGRTTWAGRWPTCAPSSRDSVSPWTSQRTAGGGPVGTVKGVAPTGTVAAGSLVTLDVVAAAPDPGPGAGTDGTTKGKGKGKGHDKRKGDE